MIKYKMTEERSQFGYYPLNQTEVQYNENVDQWKKDCQATFGRISVQMTPELRQALDELYRRQQDLTERLCTEHDNEKRERMVKTYESASEEGNFGEIASFGRIFRPKL